MSHLSVDQVMTKEGYCLMEFHGTIDVETAPLFRETILRAMHQHEVIALSVRSVGFMDTAVIAILIGIQQQACLHNRIVFFVEDFPVVLSETLLRFLNHLAERQYIPQIGRPHELW